MSYTHTTITGAYRHTGKVAKILSTAEIAKIDDMGTELASLSSASYANPTFKDASTATKTAQFTLAGATASTKTTFAVSQSANRTVTFPDATDTLVGKATTDLFTNKTLKTTTCKFGDAADTTKDLFFALNGATTDKTMTIISSQTDDRSLTLPDATDTLVGRATTDTLTNKTLTAPVLTNPATTVTLGSHDFGAAATDWTLSAAELLLPVHKPTNASGPVNVIVATTIRPYLFINATGQQITVKTAAGSGIAIANAKSAFVMSDGTNVIRLTQDA